MAKKKAPAQSDDYMDKIRKRLGDNAANQDIHQWLDTGLIEYNIALSGRADGGLAVGRIHELYGPPSCGKTSIATQVMAKTQQLGGIAVFMDFEHSFSMSFAQKFGLADDPMKWIYQQPETGEECFENIEFIAKAVRENDPGRYVTIVVDSVAAIVPKALYEIDYSDINMNTKNALAALMSIGLQKLTPVINNTNTTLIFLNQTRSVVGGMGNGPKEKTAGGKAAPFYYSTRSKLAKIKKHKGGDDEGEYSGEIIKLYLEKNKTFEPYRTATYEVTYTKGIDFVKTHIEYAKSLGVMRPSGAWVKYREQSKYMRDWVTLFESDPAAYQELLDEIVKAATAS